MKGRPALLKQVARLTVDEDRLADLALVRRSDPVQLTLVIFTELRRPEEESELLAIADPALLEIVSMDLPL